MLSKIEIEPSEQTFLVLMLIYECFWFSGLLVDNISLFDLASEGHGVPHYSKLSEFEIQSLLSNLSPIERSSQSLSSSEEGLSCCQPSVSQTSQIHNEAGIKVRCDTVYLRRLIQVGV